MGRVLGKCETMQYLLQKEAWENAISRRGGKGRVKAPRSGGVPLFHTVEKGTRGRRRSSREGRREKSWGGKLARESERKELKKIWEERMQILKRHRDRTMLVGLKEKKERGQIPNEKTTAGEDGKVGTLLRNGHLEKKKEKFHLASAVTWGEKEKGALNNQRKEGGQLTTPRINK